MKSRKRLYVAPAKRAKKYLAVLAGAYYRHIQKKKGVRYG